MRCEAKASAVLPVEDENGVGEPGERLKGIEHAGGLVNQALYTREIPCIVNSARCCN